MRQAKFMFRRVVSACVVAVWVAGLATPMAWAQADAESMGGMVKPAAAPSTNLTLTVDGRTTTFSAEQIKAMTQTTVKVHNEHAKAEETYSGVRLGELLAKAGFVADKTTQKKMLHSFVQVEGTDKYWVLYSLTEVEGSEHLGDVIVATSMNDKDLGADGEFKLVSTEDKKPQRWVRNLAAITLKIAE